MARMPHVKLVRRFRHRAPRRGAGRLRPARRTRSRRGGRRAPGPVVRPDGGCDRRSRGGVGRRRPPRAAALDRARDGAGRLRPAPRGEVRDRPGDRGRLLLRLRAPRAALVRRPARDRGPDARAGRGRRAVHPRGGGPRGRASSASPTSRSSSRSSRAWATTRSRARWAAATPSPLYRNGGLGRPVPRAARAVHRSARRVPPDQRGGRVLARRRATPDADQRSTARRGRPRRISRRT